MRGVPPPTYLPNCIKIQYTVCKWRPICRQQYVNWFNRSKLDASGFVFFQRLIKTARSIYFRFGRPLGMVGPERDDNFQPNACSCSTAMPRGSSPRHHPAVASVPPHSLRRLATAEDSLSTRNFADFETTARAPFSTTFLPLQLSE